MLLSLLYFLMLRKLCAYKEIEIFGRKTCQDHVHTGYSMSLRA